MNDQQKLHQIIRAFFLNISEFQRKDGYIYTFNDVEVCPSSTDRDKLRWYWVDFNGNRITWDRAEGIVVVFGNIKTIADFNFEDWYKKIIEIFNLLKNKEWISQNTNSDAQV